MVLTTFRRTVAALGITIAGTASGLSATAVGADPVPLEPGHTDCFGPYIARLGVIYAQPAPAITWGTAGDDIIIGSAGNDKILASVVTTGSVRATDMTRSTAAPTSSESERATST